jgi:hypothetical protein
MVIYAFVEHTSLTHTTANWRCKMNDIRQKIHKCCFTFNICYLSLMKNRKLCEMFDDLLQCYKLVSPFTIGCSHSKDMRAMHRLQSHEYVKSSTTCLYYCLNNIQKPFEKRMIVNKNNNSKRTHLWAYSRRSEWSIQSAYGSNSARHVFFSLRRNCMPHSVSVAPSLRHLRGSISSLRHNMNSCNE